MSVRLADVIEVLDEAYPPRLAAIVGLGGPGVRRPRRCAGVGDRRGRRDAGGRRRSSRRRPAAGPSPVAVARGRHRGGQHAQGRTGAPPDPYGAFAVHRAHQRRLGITGRVRRAGPGARPDRRGGAGAADGRRRPRQVGHLRAARERRSGAGGGVRGRRRPHRRLFALQLERQRHRAVPAARRGVARGGQRRHRRAGGRRPVRGHRAGAGRGPPCWRRCAPPIPTRSPAFDIFALVPPPGDAGLGRIGTLAQPEPLRDFVSRVDAALPRTAWGVRAAGDPDMPVSRVAVCGGAGDSLLRDRGRRGRAGLRHGRSAAPSGRRASSGVGRGADRRRALGERIPVVRPGRRLAAVPFRCGAAGAGVHHPHRPMEYRAVRRRDGGDQ